MAVKLRLKRMGAKKKPFYRVVAADSRSPRDGKVIEEIGYYNPITVPAEVKIDEEKAMKWLDNGAQPTDTVRSLFKSAGILERRHNAKSASKPKATKVEKAPKAEKTPKAAPKKTATKKSGK